MRDADIFIEMIRLGEQIGEVDNSAMYDNGFFSVYGKTKDGKKFCFSLSLKEENKDGN
jgi:hypothetical protein